MSDFHAHRWVVARKPHTCFGCLQRQPVGARLSYGVGVFDGDFYADYFCEPCQAVLDDMPSEDQADGVFAGTLLDGWPYLEPRPSDWRPGVHA